MVSWSFSRFYCDRIQTRLKRKTNTLLWIFLTELQLVNAEGMVKTENRSDRPTAVTVSGKIQGGILKLVAENNFKEKQDICIASKCSSSQKTNTNKQNKRSFVARTVLMCLIFPYLIFT